MENTEHGIVFIGNPWAFKAHQLALVQRGLYARRLEIDAALQYAGLHGEKIALCIFRLEIDHGPELSRSETHNGDITGVVLFKKIIQCNPNVRFIIFNDNTTLPELERDDRVTLAGQLSSMPTDALVQKVSELLVVSKP